MGFLGVDTDLVKQLTFYGSYHNNFWNQIIHIVFVPLITWSALVWAAYSGPLFGIHLPELLTCFPHWVSSVCVFNLAAVAAAAYSIFYLCLEPFAGLTWAVFVGLPMWLTATAFELYVNNAYAWALAVHALSWYMQIHLGHVLLEKRKPALLDSFFQSVALAPLFVWLEVLFPLGYRPKLKAEMEANVARNVAALREDQSKAAAAKQPLVHYQADTAGAEPAVK